MTRANGRFKKGKIMLKRLFFLVILGCCAVVMAVDYSDKSNWVIRDDAPAAEEQKFDVFYVYPTLFASRKTELMDWSDPKLAQKTVGFATAQTKAIFGNGVRVFAPYVRQLEYHRLFQLPANTPVESTKLRYGIEDTAAAFKYYMEHYNHGRPFILLGHSQGALELYCLLKNDPAITVERGFAAAYLPGLPKVTYRRFAKDFQGRGIFPARDEKGLGAVVVWNTQSPNAKNPYFTGADVLCINPLNWRTGAAPAAKEQNVEAFFYDYRTGAAKRVRHFCGAAVDPAKGALIVDLPERSEFDANGFMGLGVFHMNDIWFFAGNLRANAELRVGCWRKKFPAGRR